jgi:hypothetical protein
MCTENATSRVTAICKQTCSTPVFKTSDQFNHSSNGLKRVCLHTSGEFEADRHIN